MKTGVLGLEGAAEIQIRALLIPSGISWGLDLKRGSSFGNEAVLLSAIHSSDSDSGQLSFDRSSA